MLWDEISSFYKIFWRLIDGNGSRKATPYLHPKTEHHGNETRARASSSRIRGIIGRHRMHFMCTANHDLSGVK
jgi:hypothetical protein